MKKTLIFLFSLSVLFSLTSTVTASPAVYLYVDSAPNVYGSPDWPAYQAAAYAAVADGTFINMGTSVNPDNAGTTNFEIGDVVVYSFGDLGQRLHFFYWVPGQTLDTLTGNFEMSLYFTWDGTVYDGYDYYYGSTWLEPSSWINYDSDGDGYTDGVIGSAGWAWWGAYDVNTPEALAQDLEEWNQYVGNIYLYVNYFDEVTYGITAYHNPVPIPGAVWLLGSGLLGLAGFRKKLVS